ncbi:MAG TPA: glycoside hydrolase family 38 C-terminal domain-containing protein, partial [Terriglobales bacterium]|nr:glycoside hydrolase family 38 C-terminal domain-containing protein [Terriglobales bacterium]
MTRASTATAVLLLLSSVAIAQGPKQSDAKPAAKTRNATSKIRKSTIRNPAPDLTKQPTLYVVPYAHLDTQWRWEYPQTISEYLYNTLNDNFKLFEKYPHYVFNFSGANRYRMMKEYFPSEYDRMKGYIATGQWFPAGSSMEESDVNSPSAESVFRQVLYGNQYFRSEFGKASAEYMLPDCFGFPASLPSILAHAGVKGFSTQKLTWGSAANAGGPDSPHRTPMGTPFNVGIWEGPDGKNVIAAFNPGSYSADVTSDLSKELPPAQLDAALTPQQRAQRELRHYQDDWARRVMRAGEVSGIFTDYHYYGTGDIGGAPNEGSVKLMEAILTKGEGELAPARRNNQAQGAAQSLGRVGDGPVNVISSNAEEMFLALGKYDLSRMPRYKGELELTNHSAGSLTSQAAHKVWNRQNENLADAAEKAALAAEWLGGPYYPRERLNHAWALVMGGQFHDIQAGTATPKSYEYSWNDDLLAMNQFTDVLHGSLRNVASALETRGVQGTAVVVYNPLNVEREDVAEVWLKFDTKPNSAVAIDPDGKTIPAQIVAWQDGIAKVIFLAKVPSVGVVVYDVRPSNEQPAPGELMQTKTCASLCATTLENGRYRLMVGPDGDIANIFDKKLNKQLLTSPIRLAFQTEKPHDWPAWNMDWEDQKKPPRGYVDGPAKIRSIEGGSVRSAVEITREAEGSMFVQTIRLAAGDAGNRIEIVNAIDWKSKEAALKAVFPLAAANANATYNWDIGTLQRGNNDEKKFEVASHQWFDLTDSSGKFGATILAGAKYGSDKPDDNTLRLTLIYTPGLGGGISYPDQTTQDWGRHEFTYGIAGHAGDWQAAQTDWQAYRMDQPLIAFPATQHRGPLGKSRSFFAANNPRIRLLAMKKAEATNELIVRVVETGGKPITNAELTFAAGITGLREVNAQEQPLTSKSDAKIVAGKLVTSFSPFQPRTFAVRLPSGIAQGDQVRSAPVSITADSVTATPPTTATTTPFDAKGNSFPAELLPAKIERNGVTFELLPASGGKA